MYNQETIKTMHKMALIYFCTSFGYNFITLTKEERQKLDKCTEALHKARLCYDINYFNFYKNKN